MGLFHDYVEPLLKQNCYECHSHEAEKAKGGMVLDSRASILKGGDSGPVLVPGEPENSLMIEAILYGNEDLQMPPDYQLEQDDIARLREWISLGPPDPREGPAFAGFGEETEPPKAENLWSVQPLGLAEVPEPDLSEWETQRLESWPKNDIDRFLLTGLAEAKMSPSKDADASKLIRRIHDTLTGASTVARGYGRVPRSGRNRILNRPWVKRSMNCWIHLILGSAGDVTGWIWPAMQTLQEVTNPGLILRLGVIATTSLRPLIRTNLMTVSCVNS